MACADAHGLEVPDIGVTSVLEKIRPTSEKQWTLVNRFQTEKGEVFVKKQCMHCNQPGCVSACLVKAMEKEGRSGYLGCLVMGFGSAWFPAPLTFEVRI
jgi:Fe-S-cluster-containing dehydrogenase component